MAEQSGPADVIGLCFHGLGRPAAQIPPDAVEYFISQDLFLAILDEVHGRPDVDLTFDDGYASDVELALPALRQRQLSARFFPLAGQFGQPGYVDAAGLRELAMSGMSIGSHGMRHRSWRGLDQAGLDEELGEARARISEAAGTAVTAAAIPFGEYDRRVLISLRQRGYQQIFTSDRRRAARGEWLQPRYSIRRTDTLASVRDEVLTARPLRERIRGAAVSRVKAWR